MKFTINYQESYSRGELLLRTFFGFFYIMLPHLFLLIFVSIWSAILTFISFWVILFTGRYPQSFYEFQVNLIRWNIRVNARLYNLSDGYPSFGINGTDEFTDVQIPYPENLSRGLQILKLLFGMIYVGIPHGFVLLFRSLWTLILIFLAWWVVLFTGKYPQSWHEFNVGTLRWSTRVNLYLSYMIDDYPPFSGREDEDSGVSATAPEPPAIDSTASESTATTDEGSTTSSDETQDSAPADEAASSDEPKDDTTGGDASGDEPASEKGEDDKKKE